MKRDIRYIIKRVIIGLLIVLILSMLKNCEVKASTYYDFNLSKNPSLHSEVLYLGQLYGVSNTPTTNYESPVLPFLQYNQSIAGTGFSKHSYSFNVSGINPDTVAHRLYANSLSGSDLSGRNYFTYMIGGVYTFDNGRYLFRDLTNGNVAVGTWFPCEALTMPTGYDECDPSTGVICPNGNFTTFKCPIYDIDFDPTHNYQLIIQSFAHMTPMSYSVVTLFGIHIFFWDDLTQETINAIEQQTDAINNQTDIINSDDTTGANSQADDLINNAAFQDSTGLTAVISTPLNFISSLNNTCNPISLTLPYFKNNTQVTLPCISSLLQQKIPTVKSLLSVVINGFIIYRVLIELFYIVKSARNPEDDRIEVLDL